MKHAPASPKQPSGLDGKKLVAEVNSREREELIKDIITDRLKDKDTYKVTEIQSMESIMKNQQERNLAHMDPDEMTPEMKQAADEAVKEEVDSQINKLNLRLSNKSGSRRVTMFGCV